VQQDNTGTPEKLTGPRSTHKARQRTRTRADNLVYKSSTGNGFNEPVIADKATRQLLRDGDTM